MGEVIEAPIETRLDIPPERVLQRAATANLDCVLVIGFDRDGHLYLECSSAHDPDALWLIEKAKMALLDDGGD